MDKITGVLDALQSIFGKGFLLAGFLPATSLLTVSWVLGCWLSAGCRDLTEYLLRAKILQQFTIGLVLLLLLSMGSFVFWLLNPTFRLILEGRIFSPSIQDWLAEGHRKRLGGLDSKLQKLLDQTGRYRQAQAMWPAALLAASTGAGGAMHDGGLQREYQSLGRALDGLQPVSYERVELLYDRLTIELGLTSLTHRPELQQMRDDLVNRFVPMGIDSVERAFYRRLTDRTFQYPSRQMNVGPTRLSNIEEAQRDYLARSYGIDIALFWSDIQSIATADEKFAPVLENAKTRFDFSVAMTSMSAFFTVGWILIHVAMGETLFGSDVWVYSTVSLLGAGVTVLFHRLVLISYGAFSDTVRTAVELYRFKLMKALHLELPGTDQAEQLIWRNLAERLQVGAHQPINYDHA